MIRSFSSYFNEISHCSSKKKKKKWPISWYIKTKYSFVPLFYIFSAPTPVPLNRSLASDRIVVTSFVRLRKLMFFRPFQFSLVHCIGFCCRVFACRRGWLFGHGGRVDVVVLDYSGAKYNLFPYKANKYFIYGSIY